MKIKHKLILFFILLSIVPILSIGYMAYLNTRTIIEKESYEELNFSINAIISDVLHMGKHRVRQANELVEGFFPNQLKANGENDAVALIKIQEYIDSTFSRIKVPFKKNGDEIHQVTAVDEIDVIDSRRIVVVSTNVKMMGVEIPEIYLEKKEVFFSGFDDNAVFGKENLITIHQIKVDEDGKFAGALIIKIKNDILNLIIKKHVEQTKTGEVLIGIKNGNQVGFISDLRHTKTPPVIKIGSKNAIPIQEAIKGRFGKEVSIDYRNKEVLTVWKYIPELDWGIVSKIDTEESFKPIYELKNNLIIISGVLFILGLILVFYFSRSISNPIQQLVVAFNKMSKGELPENIVTNGENEFGQLAQSFNEIIHSKKILVNAAEQIGQGNYDVDIVVRSDKDILGNVISKMKQYLLDFNKQHGELINAESLIRQSQQRLKNIVDNIAEAIFSVDKEFRIITWHKSSERVYGYTEKEAVGKEMNELFKTDFIHYNNEHVIETLKHQEIWKGEIIQTNKAGNNIFIDAAYTHFENQKGVKEGYVVLNKDNTQNRKYEIELTNALLEGEEIERKRIATSLHDGLGQYLSALRMHIQVIKENVDTESYDDIISLIDTGIKEYRAVSHNLIPPILKEDGFSVAVNYMCDKLIHSGKIKVSFNSNMDGTRIDTKIEIELYRITQELINNVLKHANAKTLNVVIHISKSRILSIEVSDDGKGFDVEKSKTSQKSGIGIKNIISRVYLLKGKINIDSEIGKGSQVVIKLKL